MAIPCILHETTIVLVKNKDSNKHGFNLIITKLIKYLLFNK